MSFTASIRLTGDVGGVPINSTISRTGENQLAASITIPAAKTGVITDSAGKTMTLAASHGIIVGDIVDIYWGTTNRRSTNEVTVVATNLITFVDVAGETIGDAVPANATAITVCKQVTIDTDFDADLLTMIMAKNSNRGTVIFYTAGGADDDAIDLVAGEPWFWISDMEVTNPLAGVDVGQLRVSNAGTSESTFVFGALYNGAV